MFLNELADGVMEARTLVQSLHGQSDPWSRDFHPESDSTYLVIIKGFPLMHLSGLVG